MPSILSEEDKQTVKRTVPKASNKIHAVAVAKLYLAYPNKQRWTYTGLQGAAVLANDLVGNTFWIKLVDISPANRGVIWDQEIYDTFSYNTDRTFFHTFELEDCLAALSFADEKEARTFHKKINDREKNAHKNTKAKAFGATRGRTNGYDSGGEKQHHGFLGGLFSRDKHSHSQPPPAQSIIPPREVASPTPPQSRNSFVESLDPKLVKELRDLGLTEDQLADNKDFIVSYIEQTKQVEAQRKQSSRAPPPPPPPTTAAPASLSPQNTGASRRGPPPAPPPARRGGVKVDSVLRDETPSPPRNATPPALPGPRFRAPPPLEDAGRFANEPPKAPSRARASSNAASPAPSAPPPPPRQAEPSTKFGVPPPFEGERTRLPPGGPPPPPSRGNVPPPPPARENAAPAPVHAVPPTSAIPPPPLPPKVPNDPPNAPPLPPLANKAPSPASAPPPLPPSSARPIPPAPGSNAPPPPPPLPPSNNAPPPPPLPPTSSVAPPPPPLPPTSSGAPPAPPPPPALPQVGGGGRDGLLADIRGGARLKKVSESEKKDRSAALVPGSDVSAAPGASPGAGGGGGDAGQAGLAGALASALAARKSKVQKDSDDEKSDDEW